MVPFATEADLLVPPVALLVLEVVRCPLETLNEPDAGVRLTNGKSTKTKGLSLIRTIIVGLSSKTLNGLYKVRVESRCEPCLFTSHLQSVKI